MPSLRNPSRSSLAVAGLLLLPACQGITRAPEGSPRVEIEVVVDLGDAFFDDLVTEEDEALVRDIEGEVLRLADVGLRFYPVLTDTYQPRQDRPPYVMTLRFENLTVDLKHKMIEEEEQEPRIETSVSGLSCTVAAAVQKRRENAPPLLVGESLGTGKVSASRMAREEDAVETYPVRWEGEGTGELTVTRSALLRAARLALDKALATLQKPIDREFATAGS